MFYNCENLFDIYNDSLTNDDDFTPDGVMNWTYSKFKKKLTDIYKVIVAVGKKKAPDIVGLCEIENRFVLEQLTKNTPLKKIDYRIIHKESPDKRGIDVALLYNKKNFTPISYKAIEVKFPFSPESTTRDILYVTGELKNRDIVHIFVNHWPSRLGGQKKTERKRMHAAKILRSHIDKIFSEMPNANIIIMGDLNDCVDDKSLTEVLKAKNNINNPYTQNIYSMSYLLEKKKHEGTHKHEGVWRIFDHILVSGNLLNPNNSTVTTTKDSHVYKAQFLLENDKKYSGTKVKRTFTGRKYNGGFSDHLPVFIDFYSN